jgi:hypothetical protein
MVTTFNPNEVPHFFIGFNFYGNTSSDPAITEWLNSEDNEEGPDMAVLVDMVTKACIRDGLEYICDENLTESGILEVREDFKVPAVSLKDWTTLVLG